MNLLLVGINAKYSHTALAVYSIGAYLTAKNVPNTVVEYTVNDPYEAVFYDILKRHPDYIGFSSYLWNIELIKRLMSDLKKALPSVKIFLGGPEAGYHENPKEMFPLADAVISGEGELRVYEYLTGQAGEEQFGEFPFAYQFPLKKGKTVYYEASRGCPYRCSYCISSLEKQLRFKELSLVKEELFRFIENGAGKVKFIDRTFNVNPHAYEIFEFIIRHGGDTGFHFEIKPELFSQKDFELLKQAPKGLIQFEAGLQSLNPQTLQAIDRRNDTGLAFSNLKTILEMGNIHLHLDLIAGLPYEDKQSFIKGFEEVYSLRPHMLQLGFLKLLNGTRLKEQAEEFGITASDYAPYQVISTKWLSAEDIMELKVSENGLDTFSNKGFFHTALEFLWQENQVSYYDTFYQLGTLLEGQPPLSLASLFRLFDEWYRANELSNPEEFHRLLCGDYRRKNPNKPLF